MWKPHIKNAINQRFAEASNNLQTIRLQYDPQAPVMNNFEPELPALVSTGFGDIISCPGTQNKQKIEKSDKNTTVMYVYVMFCELFDVYLCFF